VGYFVLGPSDLYKLTKEIGKFVQNFRTFTTEATASLENNFESQLQLEEIRKAQRDLNEAFSFRRSINVEADTNPFEVNAKSPRMPEQTEFGGATASAFAGAAAALETVEDAPAAAAEAAPKKKIRRRRVKKVVAPVEEEEEEDDPFCVPTGADMTAGEVVNNVPDLSVEDEVFNDSEESADKALREASEQLRKEAMEEEAEERRKERIERLQQASASSDDDEDMEATNARFQAQLTGNWNDQILSKGEELNPLASVMDRLALLEQEKQAADDRLQEEFRMREENEERFYREKRQLLEEAATQIQAEIYLNPNSSDDDTDTAAVASPSDSTTAKAS
jgi:Sec-independent protein translocase protein TatA